jgi:hypothetical protein
MIIHYYLLNISTGFVKIVPKSIIDTPKCRSTHTQQQ